MLEIRQLAEPPEFLMKVNPELTLAPSAISPEEDIFPADAAMKLGSCSALTLIADNNTAVVINFFISLRTPILIGTCLLTYLPL